MELFELNLKNLQSEHSSIKEERNFDIGQVTQTYNFASNREYHKLAPYTFLRFCEEIGLPYNIGGHSLVSQTIPATLKHISQYSLFWALATFARLGKVNTADELFSRESVYRYTKDGTDQLINKYFDALRKCKDEINNIDRHKKINYNLRFVQPLIEAISRLCCRCSFKTKKEVIDFLIEVYASPSKENYKGIYNLLSRLIDSMSEIEQYSMISKFLEISFPGILTDKIKNEFINPLKLLTINKELNDKKTPDLEIDSDRLSILLKAAKSDSQRSWAITSLTKLYELGLLDNEQEKKFKEALWYKTDHYGLPDNTELPKFMFLKLPSPKNIAQQRFKEYIQSTFFPSLYPLRIDEKNTKTCLDYFDLLEKYPPEIALSKMEPTYISTPQSDSKICENKHLPNKIVNTNKFNSTIFTEEDIKRFSQDFIKWWKECKDDLGKNGTPTKPMLLSANQYQKTIIEDMLKLLSEVIIPKLTKNSTDEIKKIETLLAELRDCNLPSLRAEAAYFINISPDPERKKQLYEQIDEALTSKNKDTRGDALDAICKIIIHCFKNQTDSVSAEASDAISMLSEYIKWCQTDFISLGLQSITLILEELQNIIGATQKNAENTMNSLEGLLKTTLKRLKRLLDDTAYDDNQDLDFDLKVEVRLYSSILAEKLWRYYASRGIKMPETLKKWRSACLSENEFAEIRNPWWRDPEWKQL